MKKLLILESAEEANFFKKSPFEVDEILCINPVAEAELADSNFNVVNSLSKYNNLCHERNAELVAASCEEFSNYLASLGFDQVVCDRMSAVIFYIVSSYYYLSRITEGSSSYYWYQEYKLRKTDNQAEMLQSIVHNYLKKNRLYKDCVRRSRLHNYVLELYNKRVAQLLSQHKKLFIMSGERPVIKQFINELDKHSKFSVIGIRQPNKHTITNLRYAIKSLKKIKLHIKSGAEKLNTEIFYISSLMIKKNEENTYKSLSNFLLSREIHSAFTAFLKDYVAASNNCLKAAKEVLYQFTPDLILTDAVNSAFIDSVCREFKQQGGKVIFFNHATNSPQKEKYNKLIGNLWGKNGVIYSPNATHNVVRAPYVADLCKEIFGESVINNIYRVKYNLKSKKELADKFRIYYSGNYLPARTHVPQIVETSDEYLASIRTLAEVVSKIPEATLTIKLKQNKREFNLATAEKLMPKYDNVTFKSSGSFKEELAECDLVVSCLSATIDEALESWTPVLLYSANYRYFHLEGMSEAPTPQKRAAVYTPPKSANLANFITAIIAAHKNKPLTEAEITPYIWGEGADDMQSFAKKVLNNKPK